MKIDWLDLVVTITVGIFFMVAAVFALANAMKMYVAGKFIYAGISLVGAGLDFILLNGLTNKEKRNED